MRLIAIFPRCKLSAQIVGGCVMDCFNPCPTECIYLLYIFFLYSHFSAILVASFHLLHWSHKLIYEKTMWISKESS